MPPIDEGASGDTGAKNTALEGASGDAAKAQADAAAKATADAAAKAEADAIAKAQAGMTDEQKAADNKAREDAKAKAAKDANDKGDKDKAGAPEKGYEDFKLAEGITVDPETMDEAKVLFKEANLPQAVAQKFVDLQNKLAAKGQEAQLKAWEDLTGGWEKSLKVDKEFGGEKYEENRAIANKAIAKFADKDGKLIEALVTTRMGNHPELFRFCYRIGLAMSEDKLNEDGSKPSGEQKKDLASLLYKPVT